MFWLPKMSQFFHLKLLLDNGASFTSSSMKDLCQKWKVKLIFRVACRLPEPGLLSVWKSLAYGVIRNSLMA